MSEWGAARPGGQAGMPEWDAEQPDGQAGMPEWSTARPDEQAGMPEPSTVCPAGKAAAAVAFHNVSELEPAPGGGVYLRRFPRSVREKLLHERGRFIAGESAGCEIRFVTAAGNVRVTLCLPETDGMVTVYKGSLFHSEHRLAAGTIRTLQLAEPPRLADAPRERLSGSGFAPEVWRIVLGRYVCIYHGIETFGHPVRPPAPGETPALKWIAYGSSITNGGENSSMAYIAQAARRLRADVRNLGMSGSCMCEPVIADFLAEEEDWSMMTLELGVNMRDNTPPEQFRERVRYMLERLHAAHPGKPLFLITIYPNFASFPDHPVHGTDEQFNRILREEAERLNSPDLHLIEGDTVLTDMGDLSCDLIHPGDNGHILMGGNLAHRIAEKLRGYAVLPQ